MSHKCRRSLSQKLLPSRLSSALRLCACASVRRHCAGPFVFRPIASACMSAELDILTDRWGKPLSRARRLAMAHDYWCRFCDILRKGSVGYPSDLSNLRHLYVYLDRALPRDVEQSIMDPGSSLRGLAFAPLLASCAIARVSCPRRCARSAGGGAGSCWRSKAAARPRSSRTGCWVRIRIEIH